MIDTKIFDWKEEINNKELEQVVDILKKGGIVVFPTETVYGIGGNAENKLVVDKIYNVKLRPENKALNILLPNKEKIKKYAEVTSSIESKIIDKFMPGPLTIILKRKKDFGDSFTAGNTTIGVRIPQNKIMLKILNNVPFPLIAPSANISGKAPATNVEDAKKDFMR